MIGEILHWGGIVLIVTGALTLVVVGIVALVDVFSKPGDVP